MAATLKLIGAERVQPQATFGKQTKAIVVTTGMLAFISFWRASADRPLRPRLVSLLHRRHRRAGVRPFRAIFHSRRDAVLVRRARRLRRIVLDVHPRRSISRRQRSDGLDAGENFGVGPDVRLHPDRPHQRRLGRPIPGRLDQRAAQARRSPASSCRPISPPRFFAIAVTVYFWRQNILGIEESSGKAMRIMQITTVMAVTDDRMVRRARFICAVRICRRSS